MNKSTQTKLPDITYKQNSEDILQHNNVLLEDIKDICKEKNKELDEVNTIELLLSQIDINTTKNNCEKTCNKDLNEDFFEYFEYIKHEEYSMVLKNIHCICVERQIDHIIINI